MHEKVIRTELRRMKRKAGRGGKEDVKAGGDGNRRGLQESSPGQGGI